MQDSIDQRIQVIRDINTRAGREISGRYQEGVQRHEIEERFTGPLGGRMESFGGGEFKFIEYTS